MGLPRRPLVPGQGAGSREPLEVSEWEVTASVACWKGPSCYSEKQGGGGRAVLEAESKNEGTGPGGGWNRAEGRCPRASGESETTALMPASATGALSVPSTELHGAPAGHLGPKNRPPSRGWLSTYCVPGTAGEGGQDRPQSRK